MACDALWYSGFDDRLRPQRAGRFPQLIHELLGIVDDVVDELGSRKEIEYVYTILENGTSADRQLKVFNDHGGEANTDEALKAVVDHIIEETEMGLFDDDALPS